MTARDIKTALDVIGREVTYAKIDVDMHDAEKLHARLHAIIRKLVPLTRETHHVALFYTDDMPPEELNYGHMDG